MAALLMRGLATAHSPASLGDGCLFHWAVIKDGGALSPPPSRAGLAAGGGAAAAAGDKAFGDWWRAVAVARGLFAEVEGSRSAE